MIRASFRPPQSPPSQTVTKQNQNCTDDSNQRTIAARLRTVSSTQWPSNPSQFRQKRIRAARRQPRRAAVSTPSPTTPTTRRGCERCGRRRPPSTIPGPVARATTAACVPRAATRRTRRPSEEARAREKRRSLSSCTRVCFSRTSSWRTSLRTIRQEKTTLKKYQDFVWTSPPESSVEGLPVARTLVAAASTWMAIDISDRRA